MGIFWSNSWSLALIFCTNANKNPTFNLSIYFIFYDFQKPENRKNHKKFKNARNAKPRTGILL